MAAEGDPLIGGNSFCSCSFLLAYDIKLNDNGEFVMNNHVEPVDFRNAVETAVENAVGHSCNEKMAAVQVANNRVKAEGEIYFSMRIENTGEEWRMLFLSISSENYRRSLKLLGYCNVDGVLWALVTRIRSADNAPFAQYEGLFPRSCPSLMYYMRPQFRFLVYSISERTM
jgi:hypothetical protein